MPAPSLANAVHWVRDLRGGRRQCGIRQVPAEAGDGGADAPGRLEAIKAAPSILPIWPRRSMVRSTLTHRDHSRDRSGRWPILHSLAFSTSYRLNQLMNRALTGGEPRRQQARSDALRIV